MPKQDAISWQDIPKINTAQMRQLLSLATGRYGFGVEALMETAAGHIVALADELAPEGPVLVVVGRGHNGGAGLAAANAFADAGRRVWVVPTHEAENYSGAPKEQLEKLEPKTNVRIKSGLPKMKFACIIDAAVGTGLEGPPRGRTLDVITVVNNNGSTVLALDVPTGLDANSGEVPGDIIHATATVALGLPKPGSEPGGNVGELYVVDMGLPNEIFQEVGLEPFTFSSPRIKVTP